MKSETPGATLGRDHRPQRPGAGARVFPVFLTLIVGVTVTLGGTRLVRDAERARQKMEFNRVAADRIAAVRKTLDTYSDAIHSLAAFMQAVAPVTRKQFRDFSLPLLAWHPGIRALEWIPRITREERQLLEQSARDDGFQDFEVHELGPLSSSRAAGDRAEYFPVLYVEPYEGNERALGLDLASDPVRLEGLRQALATGRAAATARTYLVQEPEAQFGALLYVPVVGAREDASRSAHDGVVLGVFRMGDLLATSLSYADAGDVDVVITDESAPAGKRLLAWHGSSAQERGGAELPEALVARAGFRQEVTIDFGGRTWMVSCAPMPGSPLLRGTLLPFVVLVAGLLFTLLLAVYLHKARKSADQVLEQKALSDTLVNSLPGIFYLINENGWVVRWNQNLERMLGYSEFELRAMQWQELVAPEDRDRIRTAFRDVGSTDATGTDGVLLAKDGTRIPFTMTGCITRIGGSTCLVGMGIDTTARRQAEEEARQRGEELAHVSRVVTMGELAASFAHEINQPLCAIALNARYALKQYRQNASKEVEEALTDILDDGERAAEVIRHLREFLRKGGIHREPLDLDRVVQEVIGIVAGNATTLNGAAVRLEVPPGLPLVHGDRIQLQQVLLNLINNGLEAMEGQEADTRRLSIRVSLEDPSAVTVAVVDHGHGLATESIDKLFEPFYTTKPHGLGIGLSISRTIVEAHGGRMWARSNPEGGAIVSFTVPVSASRREANSEGGENGE